MDGWIDKWVDDGWESGWMDEWLYRWVGGWMNGWMGGWMGRWTDSGWIAGQMDGWMGGWVSGSLGTMPCFSCRTVCRKRECTWVSGIIRNWLPQLPICFLPTACYLRKTNSDVFNPVFSYLLYLLLLAVVSLFKLEFSSFKQGFLSSVLGEVTNKEGHNKSNTK
jgi:hypothetical protein